MNRIKRVNGTLTFNGVILTFDTKETRSILEEIQEDEFELPERFELDVSIPNVTRVVVKVAKSKTDWTSVFDKLPKGRKAANGDFVPTLVNVRCEDTDDIGLGKFDPRTGWSATYFNRMTHQGSISVITEWKLINSDDE